MQLVGHSNKPEKLIYVFTIAGQQLDETKFYSARVIKMTFVKRSIRNNVNTNTSTTPPTGETIMIHAHVYTHKHKHTRHCASGSV